MLTGRKRVSSDRSRGEERKGKKRLVANSELPALLKVLQSDVDQRSTTPLKCPSCSLAEIESRKKWASVNRGRDGHEKREGNTLTRTALSLGTWGIAVPLKSR